MAELKIELNLGKPMREAMIRGLADIVAGLAQYRFALILRLLRDDPVAAILIAESFGERALKVRQSEEYMDKRGEEYTEVTWQEIMGSTLDELEKTPGGRGEVL